jgi:isoquinoline 1-oxidoreductase subunit alpha
MQLTINEKSYEIDAEDETPLLWIIRDDLNMTGTKYGCGVAQCGACSVLVDGAVMRSCVTPASTVVGKKVTTIEAVEEDEVGRRVVAAWVKHQVPQCGYCQSGQVMAATSLLKQVAKPTEADIAAAMINLCRCGTYNSIRAAIYDLAGMSSTTQPASNAGRHHVGDDVQKWAMKPGAAALFGSIAVVSAAGALSQTSNAKSEEL